MDLKKFKYIAILFLSAALIFLSVFLISHKSQSETYPISVAKDLSRLYAEKGITLPEEVIPLTRGKQPIYTCKAATSDIALTLAEQICGSAKKATNLSDNGYVFRMENESIIMISHALDIKYSRKGNMEIPSLTMPATEDAASIPFDISKDLEDYYGDNELLLVEYLSTDSMKASNGYAVSYIAAINGTEIHGSALTVYTNEAGEYEYISGNCYFLPIESHSYSQQYDQINILTTELASLAESDTVKAVSDIYQCYVTYSGKDGNNVNFLPAWKITYTDGSFSVYDTVNMAKYIIE